MDRYVCNTKGYLIAFPFIEVGAYSTKVQTRYLFGNITWLEQIIRNFSPYTYKLNINRKKGSQYTYLIYTRPF